MNPEPDPGKQSKSVVTALDRLDKVVTEVRDLSAELVECLGKVLTAAPQTTQSEKEPEGNCEVAVFLNGTCDRIIGTCNILRSAMNRLDI